MVGKGTGKKTEREGRREREGKVRSEQYQFVRTLERYSHDACLQVPVKEKCNQIQ